MADPLPADPDFDTALDCCRRNSRGENHAPDCFTGLGQMGADAPHGPVLDILGSPQNPEILPRGDTAEETAQDRVERIEREIQSDPADGHRDDILFLLELLRRAGDQRVAGLREAAGLIRAAKNRETTTRFLVGKKEQAVRASNAKLMDVVANLIEQFAGDAAAGRV